MKTDTVEITPETEVKDVTIRFGDGHTETYAPVPGKSGVVVGVFEQDKTEGNDELRVYISARPSHMAIMIDAMVKNNPQVLISLLMNAVARQEKSKEMTLDKILNGPIGGSA